MVESHSCSVNFSFDGSASVFRDHFPAEPLVPAFMQLHAVRGSLVPHITPLGGHLVFRNVKFIRPLFPDEEVTLRWATGLTEKIMHFELVRKDEVITYGTIGIV